MRHIHTGRQWLTGRWSCAVDKIWSGSRTPCPFSSTDFNICRRGHTHHLVSIFPRWCGVCVIPQFNFLFCEPTKWNRITIQMEAIYKVYPTRYIWHDCRLMQIMLSQKWTTQWTKKSKDTKNLACAAIGAKVVTVQSLCTLRNEYCDLKRCLQSKLNRTTTVSMPN